MVRFCVLYVYSIVIFRVYNVYILLALRASVMNAQYYYFCYYYYYYYYY